MANKLNFTVIGAGHGGKAMAAHLALMGFPTTLYNRTMDHIAAIKQLKVSASRVQKKAFAALAGSNMLPPILLKRLRMPI